MKDYFNHLEYIKDQNKATPIHQGPFWSFSRFSLYLCFTFSWVSCFSFFNPVIYFSQLYYILVHSLYWWHSTGILSWYRYKCSGSSIGALLKSLCTSLLTLVSLPCISKDSTFVFQFSSFEVSWVLSRHSCWTGLFIVKNY